MKVRLLFDQCVFMHSTFLKIETADEAHISLLLWDHSNRNCI